MVIDVANVVAFQPFSPSKLEYSERCCEALREKENSMLNLHLSRIRMNNLDGIQQIKMLHFNE